jgi:cytoskeletal protein CcmA (bactofilin family)
VEKSATMKGDAICENLLIEGNMDCNIFCSGHVEFGEGSVFNGKIYTSTFKNLTQ